MDKKGTLLINRTLLSENTLATVFNESAIPAAESKTRFKFFSFFFGLDKGTLQGRGGIGVRRDESIIFVAFFISDILQRYVYK